MRMRKMDGRAGRGRIRVKLKFISLCNCCKNPVVGSYLSPLFGEEGKSGCLGDVTLSVDLFWGNWFSLGLWWCCCCWRCLWRC